MGFFEKQELIKLETPKIQKVKFGCGSCGLSKKCKTPKIEPVGQGKKKILIITEGPSAKVDRTGNAHAGDSSAFLKRSLRKFGISLEKDCLKTFSVMCYGKKVTKEHALSCQVRVHKIIKQFKPKLIILLGQFALVSFLSGRLKEEPGALQIWRGWQIPDQKAQAWVCPMYHPSFLYHEKTEDVAELIFLRDLEKALAKLNTPIPNHTRDVDKVSILTNKEEIISYLEKLVLMGSPLSAFDYEATGLKPHREEQKLKTIAIAENPEKAVAFPIFKPIIPHLQAYLASNKMGKIAANMKFEDAWSFVKLGVRIPRSSWIWDPMIGAHVCDNRANICGLKFQTYINFGVPDYDSHIAPYLRATPSEEAAYGANGLNRIDELPKRDVLLYNGLDSLYTYKLALLQMKQLGINDVWEYLRSRGIEPGDETWR